MFDFEKLKQQLIEGVKVRLKQKSTYAGLAIIVANALGLGEEYLEPMEQVVTALGGSVLVFLNTSKKTDTMQAPSIAVLIVLALTLSACGAMGMNKQQYAGINTVELQTGGGCAATDVLNQDTCKVIMVDGKEKAQVTIEVILADGTTYKYSAGEEKAFEGQAQRADVDKAVIEQAGQLVKDGIEAVKPKIGGN